MKTAPINNNNNNNNNNKNISLYCGEVTHHRLWPKQHQFTYSVFMPLIPLNYLESAFSQQKRWCYYNSTHDTEKRKPPRFNLTRFHIASFSQNDFFLGEPGSLTQQLTKLITEKTGQSFQGYIYLLTNLRYLGFQINPISLYYCVNNEGNLCYVIAEVTNTPWNERHHYVLTPQHSTFLSNQTLYQDQTTKKMHVSPFMEMPLTYHFQFTQPDLCNPNQSLIFQLALSKQGKKIFNASLNLRLKPMTANELDWFIIKHPWMTWKVFSGIYWQALKLFLKGIPFISHPKKQSKINCSQHFSKKDHRTLSQNNSVK